MIHLGVINVDASQNGHLLLKGHNTIRIVGPQILLGLQTNRLDYDHSSITCLWQLQHHMGPTVDVHILGFCKQHGFWCFIVPAIVLDIHTSGVQYSVQHSCYKQESMLIISSK